MFIQTNTTVARLNYLFKKYELQLNVIKFEVCQL